MDQSSLTITLQELIDSGCSTEYTFSIGVGNEKEELSSVGYHSRNGSPKTSVHILNSVKISILLSKAFANCDSSGSGGGSEDNNLSTVGLGHVYVNISSSEPTQDRGDLSGHNYSSDCHDKEISCAPITDSSKYWSILDISIIRPSAVQDLPNNRSMLRHLGELIYSVFSLNMKLPWPSNATERRSEVIGDDFSGNTNQSRRMKGGNEEDLFSHLMGTGDYPVSVCRLLSDMIDAGVDGAADSAFSSLDEVIEDLEQMLLNPNMFLYDADVDFKLSFGQRYYGRKKEMSQLLAISTSMEQQTIHTSADVAFVTGVPGVGKTHLVHRVGDFLSSLGWLVVKTKFERGLEHESKQRISSLFDNLVAKIVAMRDGCNLADIDYGRRATEAISGAIDQAGLSTSAAEGFIPSISNLIPGTVPKRVTELKSWQTTVLLSKLMGALLSLDRFIMLHLDDLQWCDPVMLSLMSEIIIQSGQQGRRCLFVGTIRSNALSGINPLMTFYNGLKVSKHVNVTDICPPSLTKSDVIEMTMTEMRLPKRLVVGLADAVHKKTSGLALFVVQLLNSLLRDGTVSYSPRKRRYEYDQKSLLSLKTLESFAALLVSNLTSLSNADLQNLRILSCFGMQAHEPVIHLVGDCPGVQSIDMSSSLTRLVDQGFLERSGGIVTFSHDIIHKAVRENMTNEQRGQLEFQLGVFLGSKTPLDSDKVPIEASIEKLGLSESKNRGEKILASSSSSLIALEMVNNAGPQYVGTKFAKWNLQAALDAKAKSNFTGSVNYCKKGISFLGEPWSSDSSQLCCKLHEAAAFASHAVGNAIDTKHFAEEVIKNMPFEQSIFAHLMILRSLESAGEHQETISQGLAILRALNFDIPPNPTPCVVIQTLVQTEQVASQFSVEKILSMQKSTVIDSKKIHILNLVEAVSMSCYQTASPFLPLVTCAIVNYSLDNGICTESATAFSFFGYFLISLLEKYDSGKYWGGVAENILAHSDRPNIRAALTLNGFLYLWFKPLKELADGHFCSHETAMKVGDIDGAMYTICQYWRFSFFSGQKLSTLSISYDKFMKLMVKYCYDIVKFIVLDISLTYQLMGKTDDPYSHFEGAIQNDAELIMDAKTKNNVQQLQSIALKQFHSAFYSGNYIEAALFSKEAFSFPTSNTPKIQLIFHYFYHGLTSFWLYRDGQGESYLDDGKSVIKKMEVWCANSSCTFENKLFLLQAEHLASLCDKDASIEMYEMSIKTARDNGFLHEQGLGYELMGNYLSSVDQLPEANKCFLQSYTCYMQWGAVGKAKKLFEDHYLCVQGGSENHSTLKHDR